MSSTFNYTIQLTPNNAGERMRFIPPSGEAAKQLLRMLLGKRTTPLDLNKLLTPNEVQILQVLDSLRAGISGEVASENSGMVDTLSMISFIPNNAVWKAHLEDVSGSPNFSLPLEELNKRAKSRLSKVKLPKEGVVFGRDFKDVLLKFPSNFADKNFGVIQDLYVRAPGAADVSYFAVHNPETLVTLLYLGAGDTPRGLAVSISEEDSDRRDVDHQTLEMVEELNANPLLKERASGFINPSVDEAQEILASTVALVEKSPNSLELSSAKELKHIILASADTMLKDPQSPYFNKGFTPQDLVELSKEGLFGVEGVNRLASVIAETLREIVEHIQILDLAITYEESNMGRPTGVPEELSLIRNNTVTLYNSLRENASSLFEVNAPDLDVSARENGGPARAAYILGAVALAAVTVVELCNRWKASVAEDCLEINNNAALTLKELADFINQELPSQGPDRVADLVFLGENLELDIVELLREEGCAGGYLNGLNCRKLFNDSWNPAESREEKIQKVEAAARCLEKGARESKARSKLLSSEIERLDSESLLEAVHRFMTRLPKVAKSVLEYAAYTALGLGVVWGVAKVVKSIRRDRVG